MILTITLNPCVDKSSKLPQLQPEAKLRCTQVLNEAGGGGINVSKALMKLGSSSIALFPSGGHNGDMLCSLLRKEGIVYHSTQTQVETRENWIILEEATNNQYRFTFPGLSVNEKDITTFVNQIKHFAPHFVVASGSLPDGLPDSFYGYIVDITKSINAKAVIDTSGPALVALKNKGAYLIKPNLKELAMLLDVDSLKINEVDDAALQAIQNGYAEMIAVSMGAQGAWLVTKNEKYFAAAPDVPKKSTVGAGDSMVAGMVYMLEQNRSLKEVIHYGVACGSAATMNEGSQLFNYEDVQKLFAITSTN